MCATLNRPSKCTYTYAEMLLNQAAAVLAEAEWWLKGHICENSRLCEGCLRVGTYRAAAGAPEEK